MHRYPNYLTYLERLIGTKNSSIFARVVVSGSVPHTIVDDTTIVALRRHAAVDHVEDGIAVLLASGEGRVDDGTGLGCKALCLLSGNAVVVGGNNSSCGCSLFRAELLAILGFGRTVLFLLGGNTSVVGGGIGLALEDPVVVAAAHLLGSAGEARRGNRLDAACIEEREICDRSGPTRKGQPNDSQF